MIPKTRMTRAESKARTRDGLVAAARRVFLERGYHGATLEAVAAEAGFSTGAVYSTFRGGKADLFLAVLDAHLEERARQMETVVAGAESAAAHAGHLARQFAALSGHDRGWAPLVIEFWAHAARDTGLRDQFAARHEALKAAIARMIDETLARTGQRLVLPTARWRPRPRPSPTASRWNGSPQPDGISDDAFADVATAIMDGLRRGERGAAGRATRRGPCRSRASCSATTRWSRDAAARAPARPADRAGAVTPRSRTPVLPPAVRRRRPDGPVDLARLPVTDKATLMAHFDDVVTDPRLRLDDLERPTWAAWSATTCTSAATGVLATGGSTGRRGVFVADRAEWRTYLGGLLRINAYLGLRPRLLRAGGWRPSPPHGPAHVTYRMSRSPRHRAPSRLRLDATTTSAGRWPALNRLPARVPLRLPVGARTAGGRAGSTAGCGSRRTTLVSSGETLTAGTQRAVRAAWDVPWFQIYGTTEMPVLGAHCDRHTGLHLFEDLAIVEVVDDPPRLLVTNLVARAQPLIRYAVTDLTTAAPEPCPCGRPYRCSPGSTAGATTSCRCRPPAADGCTVHPLALRGPMATVAGLQPVPDRPRRTHADGGRRAAPHHLPRRRHGGDHHRAPGRARRGGPSR